MSHGDQRNLVPTERGTSGPAAVKAHALDRLAAWVLWLSAVATVVSLWLTRGIWRDAWNAGQFLVLAALFVAFAGFVGTAFFVAIVSPTVGNRLSELADVAEKVAAGDLTARPTALGHGGQIGRLAVAMESMAAELLQLATHIRASARDTTVSAGEITAGTENLAQAAAAIAGTASSLSHEASQMADTIAALAQDTLRLGGQARQLATGARDGLERNRRLMALAGDNHERLDDAGARLAALAEDVQANAHAIDALGAASDEIRAFITLVQKIARQSKLLALNAAMEAARAGEQGEGFAVVATEVRRLAATSTEAAEQTETLVQGLLARLEDARAASARALDRVGAVREGTEHSRQSFSQVEAAVREADQWTSAMAESAASSDQLASDLQQRLAMLNAGTQAFVNAMHEVAAASEEQSASTQEITAAASHLAQSAAQLDKSASAFRTS